MEAVFTKYLHWAMYGRKFFVADTYFLLRGSYSGIKELLREVSRIAWIVKRQFGRYDTRDTRRAGVVTT